MKNIISITALLLFTCLVTGQIRVTPEGYPLLPKKPSIITLVDNDSIMVQTDDGIVRDISFGDFKSLLPSTGTGSEFIKVTPAEYLALTPTELAENDYMIVDSKASVSIDFMYESIYDTDGNGAVDDSEMLGGQLPSHYLDNTVRTDEEIEDIIGSKIVGGTNVTTSYNDTTGETTINSTASGGTSDHGGLTGLGDDDHPQYFNQPRGDARYLQSEVDGSTTNELQTISKSGSTVTLSNGGGSFSDSNTQRTNEEIEDIIGSKIVGGTNVTTSYNDTTGETTINSSASGGVTDGDKGDITVSSGTWNIDDGVIGLSNIATGAVSTSKILNNTIQNEDLASNSVSSSKISNGTILGEDISTTFYDQGTYTPSISDAGGGATYSYSSSIGRWRKIGDLVFLDIFINLITTSGTATGAFEIGNLPASIGTSATYIGNVSVQAMSINGASGDSFYDLQAIMNNNGTDEIRLIHKDPVNTLNNQVTVNGVFFDSGSILITMIYRL